MRKVELAKTGEKISIIGQGTWGLNNWRSKAYYHKWKEALRKGIELGMNHIDTAEVYGWGKAETITGEIIKEYNRDDLFITSKLFPIHFTYANMKKAAVKSLHQLNIDCLDLYLIHSQSVSDETCRRECCCSRDCFIIKGDEYAL